jgi:hypothetical protein
MKRDEVKQVKQKQQKAKIRNKIQTIAFLSRGCRQQQDLNQKTHQQRTCYAQREERLDSCCVSGRGGGWVGCALTFASEAKFEIEAKKTKK